VALCLGILNLFLGLALNVSANKASLGGWVSAQCRPRCPPGCSLQPLALGASCMAELGSPGHHPRCHSMEAA
jgi:hypothetical protein